MNLDAMDIDELWNLWQRTNSVRPVITARELFPERPKGYVAAAKTLGHYAANKATAMKCRLAGKIQDAILYEGICDSIYCRLPSYARW